MGMLPASRPKMTRADVEALALRHGMTAKFYIVGIRGYYEDTMGAPGRNDRGIYDDALFLVSPHDFAPYNGNTDPSRVRKGRGTGAGKGMAKLKAGLWNAYRFGVHKAGTPTAHEALRQAGAQVTVIRDGIDGDYEDTGWFWINIHRGGRNTTSSEGCQTIHPDQWPGFIATAHREAQKHFGPGWRGATIPYLLIEQDELDAGVVAAAPAITPASPALQPASWWPDTLRVAAEAGAAIGAGVALAAPVTPPPTIVFGQSAGQIAEALQPPSPGKLLSPKGLFSGFIAAHEGELSVHPSDNGNWYDPARYRQQLPQRRNMGVNVGSKYGVTAYALIAYRLHQGMALQWALNVTRETMAALDLETAIDVGVVLYYQQPGFAKLPWNRVTMSVVDKGWGSGPGTAIDMLQELIGASTAGGIGPETIGKYTAFIAKHGEDKAAQLWAEKRKAFDLDVATNQGANDPDRVFLNGWNNRTNAFLPGTPWWRQAGGAA